MRAERGGVCTSARTSSIRTSKCFRYCIQTIQHGRPARRGRPAADLGPSHAVHVLYSGSGASPMEALLRTPDPEPDDKDITGVWTRRRLVETVVSLASVVFTT